ncbi:hypothetical protein B0H17DRAFT_1135786 [Mycena rosella]|uniref:Uncharacterized protein n=1 Tax=Mycena rosella TaxID=1033263 RepID=A0AAD7DC19_MYCRO|nr:hypothetical protein B0H17DRAFT_1135786 [Mycena rosella]
MFRSFRAQWLMDLADEVEVAHDILVGGDSSSDSIRKLCRDGLRGPHMPIIIGHHRQSSKRPHLTAWHHQHQARVDTFMEQPVIKRIINWITDVVEIVFPGIAHQFKQDAKWHEEHYGIKPMFGLFWNLCLNAWLKDQKSIHCGPHADKKISLEVCYCDFSNRPNIDVFGLENLNHHQRTWIVIWEAGVAVQLPPWVLAMYPSALFYHFNIDVDEIKFVTVDGDERPTPQNSQPIRDGDGEGRGSFVFFNQSTMRHGPATGFNTLEDAEANGVSCVIDYGESIQDAFTRCLILKPLDHEL